MIHKKTFSPGKDKLLIETDEATEDRIDIEKIKMHIEESIFGKWLIVGTGESESFWSDMKRLSDNKSPRKTWLKDKL